jgi:hypothetical protein
MGCCASMLLTGLNAAARGQPSVAIHACTEPRELYGYLENASSWQPVLQQELPGNLAHISVYTA